MEFLGSKSIFTAVYILHSLLSTYGEQQVVTRDTEMLPVEALLNDPSIYNMLEISNPFFTYGVLSWYLQGFYMPLDHGFLPEPVN